MALFELGARVREVAGARRTGTVVPHPVWGRWWFWDGLLTPTGLEAGVAPWPLWVQWDGPSAGGAAGRGAPPEPMKEVDLARWTRAADGGPPARP